MPSKFKLVGVDARGDYKISAWQSEISDQIYKFILDRLPKKRDHSSEKCSTSFCIAGKNVAGKNGASCC
jgi:hypothetical protein